MDEGSSRSESSRHLANDLRVTGIRALRGPNIWHAAPVVVAEVHVGALHTFTPGSLARVEKGVRSVSNSGIVTAGSWPELIVTLTQELQRRAGSLVQFGCVTGAATRPHAWMIAVAYDEAELAVAALREAARILRDWMRGDTPDIDSAVTELTRIYRRATPGVHTAQLIAAARERGIPVRRIGNDDVTQLGLGAALHIVPRDVPASILDSLFPPSAPLRIPVIAVTGTNGKTTTTRLIARIFRESERRVGYTTTDGIYFQEQLLMEGDFTGPFAANVILSHKHVDVAVLETARGGILRSGLGFDECDVGVVMNVTSDHLGLRDVHTIEQLADVKAVIPSAVRKDGYAVLNADDPLVLAMRTRTSGTIVLFSMMSAGENPAVEAHLAAGGTVARVERVGEVASFVIRQRDEVIVIAAVADVPLTFGGLARFQFGNVLAAMASAYVLGVSPAHIVAAVMSFAPSAANTPGRLNVVETDRGQIILDYAHNAAAISGLLDFVALVPATRRIAVLTAPGDRRDEDLREVGRLAAGMDLVILKEHPQYRRGRAPGEVARIITEGLIATGFPPERTATFSEEHDAVAYLLESMRPGDVVTIVADDLPAVMEQLRPHLR